MVLKAAALVSLTVVVLMATATPGEARSMLADPSGPSSCSTGFMWLASGSTCVSTPTGPLTANRIKACTNKGQYAFLARSTQVACTADGGKNKGGNVLSVNAANEHASGSNSGGNDVSATGANGGGVDGVVVRNGPASCGTGLILSLSTGDCIRPPTGATTVNRIKACTNKGQYAVFTSASQVACTANGGTNEGGNVVSVNGGGGSSDSGGNTAAATGADGGIVTGATVTNDGN